MKVSIKSQIHLMLKLKQRWAKCMAIDPKQRRRKLFQVVGAGPEIVFTFTLSLVSWASL